jgi:DNA-binding transcriptional regulator LsrR (DeoR family)
MKKIIHKIDPKTGRVEVKVEGVSGPGCQDLTKGIQQRLGMDQACAVPLPEMYQQEQEKEKELGGS